MTNITPLTSNITLNVLREVVKKKEGNYPSQIARKIDVNQTAASDHMKELRELNLVKRGKRTRAQYYEVNPEGLVSLFCDIWDLEEENIPEEFGGFLVYWVKEYDKGESTIQKMLRDHFAEAVNEYRLNHDEELPEGLEFLENAGKMEGYLPLSKVLKMALEQSDL